MFTTATSTCRCLHSLRNAVSVSLPVLPHVVLCCAVVSILPEGLAAGELDAAVRLVTAFIGQLFFQLMTRSGPLQTPLSRIQIRKHGRASRCVARECICSSCCVSVLCSLESDALCCAVPCSDCSLRRSASLTLLRRSTCAAMGTSQQASCQR